jgi:hypothetical protein
MSPNRLKVENEPIVRDCESGALLFTNKVEIDEYNRKKERFKVKQESYKNDINTMKMEIAELKTLILKLSERVNNQESA